MADMEYTIDEQNQLARPLRYKGRRALAGKPNLVVKTSHDQPLRTITTGNIPTTITVLTPPLTPQVSFDTHCETNGDQSAGFYNYLRVFYHFQPSQPHGSDAKESSITIPINQGDIVLVHSVQPNGWADGTLLNSGERGWLPTNYCKGYDHDHIRVLLNALTYVWEFIRGHEGDERAIFARQDYVRCMIAGVRVLLERSGCLNRDSEPIKTSPNLRRMRKGLLGDLSTFAKGAKSLQDACQESQLADVEFYPLLDAVVLKAFKVLIRAIRFLDTWILDVSPGTTDGAQEPGAKVGVSQNSDRAGALVSTPHLPSPTNTLPGSYEPHVTTPNTACLTNPFITTPVTARASQDSDHLFTPALPASPDRALAQPSPSNPAQDQHVPASATSSSLSPNPIATPSPIAAKRASASHRLSHNSLRHANPSTGNDLASDRLHSAHDAFLSNLGAFIGLHLQSRPAMELLVTTQQSVVACQALLNIVEAVYQRDFRRSGAVDESRLLMHAHLAELVHATKDILEATEAANAGDVCLPEQGKRLMDAATMCVRSAGDCVAKSRGVIERIGDFEIDFHGLAFMEAQAGQEQEQERHTPRNPPVEQQDEEPRQDPRSLRAPSPHYFSKRSSSLPPPREPSKPPPPPPSQPVTPNESTRPTQWKQLPQRPIENDSPATSFASESEAVAAGTQKARLLTLDVDIPQTSFIDMNETPSTPVFDSSRADRADSQGEHSVNGSSDSYRSSHKRHSSGSTHMSTRATTPDHNADRDVSDILKSSIDSLPEEQAEEAEAEVLAENHAHELIHNKDGMITGGSMPALVERLTTHDSTPDALFVTTFYLTFRLFTTPLDLAQTLIDRFDRMRDDSEFATPVRLRVYNVFKGWLEAYWHADTDAPALAPILRFATSRLQTTLPSAARRLIELSTQFSELSRDGQPNSKMSTAMTRPRAISNAAPGSDAIAPPSIVSKSQLNLLRNFKNQGTACTILDLDPTELARQFTLLQMKVFCAIQPDELLALQWTKKESSKAANVRAMSALSTDLANLVADTILQWEAKKRATAIKHWVKIAEKCHELGNYDALMAIICSLNSSMVLRLKKTWDLVSPKTLGKLDLLKAVIDCSRNYAVLRNKTAGQVAPCLPFVGIYLTDLTFIDAGNPDTRQLPGTDESSKVPVINFDKHMKTIRIITDLQRFQVPYKLTPVPEMQDWMESQINRIRNVEQGNVQNYYRRSLMLEPREAGQVGLTMPPSVTAAAQPQRASPSGEGSALPLSKQGGAQPGARERFEFWSSKHFPMNKDRVTS